MINEQIVDAPDNVDDQQPVPGQGDKDYISKVHATLKDNIGGFNKSEDEFRKLITTDKDYRQKVYKTLHENIDGFSKTQDDFESNMGVKKKDGSQSGSSDTKTAQAPPSPGSGSEDKGFQQWKSQLPKDLQNDQDYDLYGLYKNNPTQKPSPNLHFPDTYKKPNHITFSDQSVYNDPSKGIQGGKWANEKGKDVFYASQLNINNAGDENKLQDYFKKYEPNVKLVLPKPASTLDEFFARDGVKTPKQMHSEEVAKSIDGVNKVWSKIDPLAAKVVNEDKLADMQKQFGQSLNHPGSDATRANVQGPTSIPSVQVATDKDVQQIKATPEGQRQLLNRQIQDFRKEGKNEDANKLQAALYNTDRGAADSDEKARQRLQNTLDLQKGELKYSPVNQQLIKPTGLGQSVTDAWDKRNEDIELFDAADEKSDKDLAAHLDYLLKQQNDPDKPRHVPEGLAGATGQFLGDQGMVGAGATALSAIPVAGEALAGGLYAHEMGRRTYGQELLRTYSDLRRLHPDMSPEDAVSAAKAHAKRAGITDAVTGGLLGATTGALGKAKLVEGEVPGMAVAAIPKPSSMLAKAVTKGYDFLKESLPAGAANAGLFSAGQIAKNASAQAAGVSDRDITEGSLEAGATALGYHLAFGLLGKGLSKLGPALRGNTLQGMSKLPIEEVHAIANEQVRAGIVTPEEAQATTAAIGEHKELDAQVPAKVKNDEVRLDLQKNILKRKDLEQELSTVNKAFHPDVKEKIQSLDEKMNELANSPEAKQPTPEPKPAPENKVEQTSVQSTQPDENVVDVATKKPDTAIKQKEQPLETANHKVVYEDGQRVAYDKTGNKIPEFDENGRRSRKWKNIMNKHEQSYNYNFGEAAPEPTHAFANEKEAGDYLVSNSSNPSEIAEAYAGTEKEATPMSSIEQAIANHGVGKVKSTSFYEVDDRNNANNSLARSYLVGSDNATGQTLDQVAKSISEHAGVEVHPEDVADFMKRFPNGNDPNKLEETDLHQAAKERFEKLTGIPLNDRTAALAVKQLHSPEEITKATKETVHQVDSMPDEDLHKWLQEQSNYASFDTHELPSGIQDSSNGEAGHGEPDNQQTPSPAGGDADRVVQSHHDEQPGEVKEGADKGAERPEKPRTYKELADDFDEHMKESEALAKLGDKTDPGTEKTTTAKSSRPATVTEALDKIAEHYEGDKLMSRTIDVIKPILESNPAIKIDNDFDFNKASYTDSTGKTHKINPDALGYSLPDGTILVSWNKGISDRARYSVIAHELVHAATRAEINTNSAFRGELSDILGEVRNKLKLPDNGALISHLVERGYIDENKYGATNEHELVAEVFSNQKFYDMLKGMEYKGDNLLKKAYQTIAKFFSEQYKKLTGAKAGITADNLADYLMDLTEKTVKGGVTDETGGALALTGKSAPDKVVDWASKQLRRGEDEANVRQVLKDKLNLTDQEAQDYINKGHDFIHTETVKDYLLQGRTDEQIMEYLKRKVVPDARALTILGDAKANPIDPKAKAMAQAQVKKEYFSKEDDWLGNREFGKVEAAQQAREFQDRTRESVKSDPKQDKYSWKDIDRAIHLYNDIRGLTPEELTEYKAKLDPKTHAKEAKIFELSQKLNDKQKAIADDYRKEYEKIGEQAKDAGIINELKENYVARSWDMKGKPASEVAAKFKTSTKHSLQRTLGSILQGYAEGMHLKIEGASNNLSTLKTEINNVVENRRLLQQGLRLKDTDGNALFSTNPKEGYKLIDSPAFKKWDFAGKLKDYTADERQVLGKRKDIMVTEDGGVMKKSDVFAPEDVAKSLNNILGKSKLDDIKLIAGISKFNAAVKQSILSYSGFHYIAFSRAHVLSAKGLEKISPISAYKAGLRMVSDLTPEFKELIQGGLTISRKQDFDEVAHDSGTWLGKQLDKNNFTKVAKDKMVQLNHDFHRHLFETYGAGLKTFDAVRLYQNELAKNPGGDRKAAAARVSKLMNDTYGGINWQRMRGSAMQDPTVRRLTSLLLLAPDWTASNLRFAKKAFERGDEGTLYRKAWARVILRGVALTGVANAMMALVPDTEDDKNLSWDQRFVNRYKEAWTAGRLKSSMIDISPLYHMIGGAPTKKAYFSIFGAYTDPMKLVSSPLDFLEAKTSFVTKLGLEASTSQNWQHREFTNLDELLGMDDKGQYSKDQSGHTTEDINPKTGENYKRNQTEHHAGDEKGGKLKGQLTKWPKGGAHPIGYQQLPSFALSEVRGMMPTAIQNLWQIASGENDATTGILNATGTGVLTNKK